MKTVAVFRLYPTILPNVNAFQILVVKLRPCSGKLSSNSKSPPAGEHK